MIKDSTINGNNTTKVLFIFQKTNLGFDYRLNIPGLAKDETLPVEELSEADLLLEFERISSQIERDLHSLENLQANLAQEIEVLLDGVSDVNSLMFKTKKPNINLFESLRSKSQKLNSSIFGDVTTASMDFPWDENDEFEQSLICEIFQIMRCFYDKYNLAIYAMEIAELHITKLIAKDIEAKKNYENLVEKHKAFIFEFQRSFFSKLRNKIESFDSSIKSKIYIEIKQFTKTPAKQISKYENDYQKVFKQIDLAKLPDQTYSIGIYNIFVEFQKYIVNGDDDREIILKSSIASLQESLKNAEAQDIGPVLINLIRLRQQLNRQYPANNHWSKEFIPEVIFEMFFKGTPFEFMFDDKIDFNKINFFASDIIKNATILTKKYPVFDDQIYGNNYLLPRFDPKEVLDIIIKMLPRDNAVAQKILESIENGNYTLAQPKFGIGNFNFHTSGFSYLPLRKSVKFGNIEFKTSRIQSWAMTIHEIFHYANAIMRELTESVYSLNEFFSVLAQFAVFAELKQFIQNSDQYPPEFKELAILEIDERLHKREMYEDYSLNAILTCFELMIHDLLDKTEEYSSYEDLEPKMLEIYNQTIGEFLFKTQNVRKPVKWLDAAKVLEDKIWNIAFSDRYIATYMLSAYHGQKVKNISVGITFSALNSLFRGLFAGWGNLDFRVETTTQACPNFDYIVESLRTLKSDLVTSVEKKVYLT